MAADRQYTLTGVMGWPVAHSRSPVLHNHWIVQYGLSGAYVLLPVEPHKLEAALRALPVLGFSGCNLTIPHKVMAIDLVDTIDPFAQKIGAINTIVVDTNGALSGRNTDAFGFIQSLLDAKSNWQANSGPITVVGAGGAARAVLVGLIEQGATDIRLTNRSWSKAHDMAQEFAGPVNAIPWQERCDALLDNELLVNTTSQGMYGEEALDLQLDLLPTSALVCDIIYVPLQTPLLNAAKARGNRTLNGLGMLINQARPAFESWYGKLPAVSSELLRKVHATF